MQYVGALPSGQIAYFDSPEAMAAAGAVNPNPIQLSQYAGSKGCSMAQGCSTAPQQPPGTPASPMGTYQIAGQGTYNLTTNGKINQSQVLLASDPTAQVVGIMSKPGSPGNLVVLPGSVIAGGAGAIQQALAGLGYATFSAGAGSTSRQQVQAQQGYGMVPAGFARQALDNIASAGSNVIQGASSFLPAAFMMPGLAPVAMAAAAGNFVQSFLGSTSGARAVTSQPQQGNVADAGYQPVSGEVFKAIYTPEGRYAQQQLESVKLGVAPKTGELGYYEKLGVNEAGQQRMAVNPETEALESYILIGGGGRYTGQSGAVTFAAATPAVYGRGQVQKGYEGLVTPIVAAPGVAEGVAKGLTGSKVLDIIAGGDAYNTLSRLGAEAYGGTVQYQDKRTLGGITYEDASNRGAWNLARYLNPTDVNLGKSEAPGARIPWSVAEGTPAAFEMTPQGGVGRAMSFGATTGMNVYVPSAGENFVGTRGSAAPSTKVSTVPTTPAKVEMVVGPDGKQYPIEFMGGQSGWSRIDENGRLIGSKTVAGAPVISDNVGGLPAPFRSTFRPTGTNIIESSESALSNALGLSSLTKPTTEQIKATGPLLGISPAAPFGLALLTPGISEYAAEYLKGEITGFTEKPATMATSFVAAGLLGAGLRSAELSVGAARSAAAPAIISEGGAYRAADIFAGTVMKYGPTVLATAYGAETAARTTNLGSDLSPAAAGRAGVITATELRPMAAGATLGYATPGKAYDVARGAQIELAQARVEIAADRTALLQKPTTAAEVSFRDAANYILGPKVASAKVQAGEIISGMAGDITVPRTIELSGKPSASPFERLSNTVLKGAVTARVLARPTIEAGLGRASIEVARYRYAENQPIAEAIYGKYFDVKGKAPAKAEAALVSAESGLWTAYQMAKTPGVNIRSAIQESGFKIDTTNIVRPSEEINRYNRIQESFTEATRIKPISEKRGDLPSLNKYYQSLNLPQAAPKSKPAPAVAETKGASGATLVSKIESTEVPRADVLAGSAPIQINAFGLPQYPTGPSPIQKRFVIEEETEYLRLPPGMAAPLPVPKSVTRQNIFEVAALPGLLSTQTQRQDLLQKSAFGVSSEIVKVSREESKPAARLEFGQALRTGTSPFTIQTPRATVTQTTSLRTEQVPAQGQRQIIIEQFPPFVPLTPRGTGFVFPTMPLLGGGGGPGGGSRKYYGKFREVLMGINYGGFNIRSGTGAKRQSIKGRKSQQVSFKNVSNAITGKRRKKK